VPATTPTPVAQPTQQPLTPTPTPAPPANVPAKPQPPAADKKEEGPPQPKVRFMGGKNQLPRINFAHFQTAAVETAQPKENEPAAAPKSKRGTPETAKEKKSSEDKPGEDEAAKNDGSGKADTKSKRTDKSNEEEGKKSAGVRVSQLWGNYFQNFNFFQF